MNYVLYTMIIFYFIYTMSLLDWQMCEEKWKLSSLLTLEEVDLYLNDQVYVH